MSELYEKLNDIKKEKNNETRMKRLKEVCNDRDILNDALKITKNESTIALPGATLITALSAILIAVMSAIFINLISDATLRAVSLFGLLILYYVVIWIIVKFEFERWKNLYYDLIELRRERREELDISK